MAHRIGSLLRGTLTRLRALLVPAAFQRRKPFPSRQFAGAPHPGVPRTTSGRCLLRVGTPPRLPEGPKPLADSPFPAYPTPLVWPCSLTRQQRQPGCTVTTRAVTP